MSGRPSRKSAKIGLFGPFSAFFAIFQRAQTALGKSRKWRKKAFFIRYPLICLNPHLLNPHLRHSNSPAPRSDWSQIENKFSRKLHKLVFPKMSFPRKITSGRKGFQQITSSPKESKAITKHHHFQKCQSFFGCGEGPQGGQP